MKKTLIFTLGALGVATLSTPAFAGGDYVGISSDYKLRSPEKVEYVLYYDKHGRVLKLHEDELAQYVERHGKTHRKMDKRPHRRGDKVYHR